MISSGISSMEPEMFRQNKANSLGGKKMGKGEGGYRGIRVSFDNQNCDWLRLWVGLMIISSNVMLTFVAADTPGDETPILNVTAVMENRALLPCDMTTARDDDKPVLVMFYKNDSGTPIYTVDMREGRRSEAKHVPISSLNERATFDLKRNKSGLKFKTIWSTDEGLYRCRVDFKGSPTKNSWIHLRVIVPPASVRIMDETGSEKSATIGPYVLGQTLTLKCIAEGGRPAPKLTWEGGFQEVRGKQSNHPGNTPFSVVNTMTIPSLQRHHLHQSFACNAANSDLAVPITAAVTVDMTLPPISITLSGISGPVSANVPLEITCRVTGARPTPMISLLLDGREIPERGQRSLYDGNVTESSFDFTPRDDDQGRLLTCKGETPGLLEGDVRDMVKLDVKYIPVVSISLNPRLNRHRIQEGADVYFTCSIRASPPPTSVHWYHNNVHLHPNSSRTSSVSGTGGVKMSNVSLTVRSVGRQSKGDYTCKASNSEGTGSSLPYHLDVKYRPICKTAQKWHYGVSIGERATILCEVDANPGNDVSFSWTFNKTGEVKRLPEDNFMNNGTVSMLNYTPESNQHDYGLLICQSFNSIGKQSDPCFYTVFPAAPPDPLHNCSVTNDGLDSVRVHCHHGDNGGLPQSFVMEVFETTDNKLKSNLTQTSPSFIVRGLHSGQILMIKLYATNSKGRSKSIVLNALTHGDAAEKQTSLLEANELPSTMELYPSLPIILGVIGGIVVVFLVIVAVVMGKRPHMNGGISSMNQEDSRMHILKKDDSSTGRQEGDERDPDVIPESRGSRTDCGDEQHSSVVADVSTLYGEMITMNPSASSVSIHQDVRCTPSSVAHIYVNNQDSASAHYLHSGLSDQQQMQLNSQNQMIPSNSPSYSTNPHVMHHTPLNYTMSVHPITPSSHVMSPTIMSPNIVEATSPSVRVISPLPQSQQQIPPNTSTFQPPNNAVLFQSFTPKINEHGQLPPNQFRLQHTHSLQHNYNIPANAQQKMSHQHSLPERPMFSTPTGSAVAYANAHLLTSAKNPNSQHPPVAQISVNPLNNHPHHVHHHHESNHRNSHPQHTHQVYHNHDNKHNNQQHQHKPKHMHSGSRSSLVSMGAGSTQTLPHPKSQTNRSNHAVVNINTATLGRKSSLFIDPLTTPIAPPASYASSPPSGTTFETTSLTSMVDMNNEDNLNVIADAQSTSPMSRNCSGSPGLDIEKSPNNQKLNNLSEDKIQNTSANSFDGEDRMESSV